MRSSKSRSRNKSNRNKSVGNIVNRVFDSSGPEGKVRGTPQQIIDKYNQLARDSQLSGDRVATENFQQHAEHYLRMLGAAQKEQEKQREQQDAENRKRQSERDRERARQDQDQDGSANSDQDRPQAAGLGDQPDVIENGGETDSGLVETPESQSDQKPEANAAPKSKPKRTYTRKRKDKPADSMAEGSDNVATGPDSTAAAE
ncbi:DUF4167 domain-containing protein [Pseudooceanicola sp. C21-150M6]|uniref:DUF4167 domain-containing protein n=1 Tax=Pseudooceanicola sp. C21-150M6 TaxID=3434355 RepID=UPI003D7F8786